MEVYVNLCADYCDSQVRTTRELVNESVKNHGLFQTKLPGIVESHLKQINVLLRAVKTRYQGFQLLLPILEQGSQEVIEKRIENWFGPCCQSLTSLCGTKEKIIACEIIILLLQAAKEFPELQKSFLTKLPSSVIQSLATADSSWNFAALKCLYEFVRVTPGQCISQKALIETNMLNYLDAPLAKVGEEDIVKMAGQVYAALPLPGMGGNRIQGRAEARGQQVTQLIALAHSTMDLLFEGVVERESYAHTREYTLKVQSIKVSGKKSVDTVKGFFSAVTRLGNILKFISQMMTSESNESISVVPVNLLGPLFRLLQVDSRVLKSYRSQEHQLLSFLIVSLHHHCLLVLRDLITSVGEGLDLLFGVISDLLVSIIKMSYSKSDNSAWCASGIQTRIIAYSVLSTIVQTTQGRHAASRDLIAVMSKDIIPQSQLVTLQRSKSSGLQSLTVQKRKKKKGYQVGESSATKNSGPLFQADSLCRLTKGVLSLAESLFTFGSHSMPFKLKRELQMNILRVTEIVSSSSSMPGSYTCGKTRAQMYRTLASIATHPDPRCPPPYTMILHLLQQGQQDNLMLVSTMCQSLIVNVSFILSNPQISLMTMVHQHQNPMVNGQGEEEDEDISGPNEIAKKKFEVDDDDDVDGIDTMDSPNEDEDENEESNETVQGEDGKSEDNEDKAQEIAEVMEAEETQSDEVDKEETDVDESDSENEMVQEVKEDKEKKEEKKAQEVSTKSEGKRNSSVNSKEGNTQVTPTKRKTEKEEESSTPAKSNKKAKKTTEEGPSLDEMLSSFIDADPDD